MSALERRGQGAGGGAQVVVLALRMTCAWYSGRANHLSKAVGPSLALAPQVTSLPRVLIVEDDAAIRAMLTAALGREALAIDTAGDGIAALEQLAPATYAVIIVDLMMPRMDGYSFLEAFRELDLPARPLVFVMTAYDDVALLKLDGTLVHGYLKKPFDVEQVVKVVVDAATALHAEQQTAIAREAPAEDVARNVC